MANSKKRGKGRCTVGGKVRFRDKREGLLVVHGAQAARHRAEVDGVETRRRECRLYQCPRCRGWHATSQAA